MNFNTLVVNGCSYMEQYALGNGHGDLADRLKIPTSDSIALGGSCNSRIIRTTLKHSYQTSVPTLYVIGLTFLSRTELPVLSYDPKRDLSFEGKWLSVQNNFADSNTGIKGFMTKHDRDFDSHLSERDIKKFIDLKLKFEFSSVLDRLDDLQYRLVSMINDLHSRGHEIVMYNQADNLFFDCIDDSRLDLLDSPHIIDRLRWRAVPYQKHSGTPMTSDEFERGVPEEIRHPQVGAHENLNQFLAEYVQSTIKL